MFSNRSTLLIFRIALFSFLFLSLQSCSQITIYDSEGKNHNVEYLWTEIEILGGVNDEGLGKLTRPKSFGVAGALAVGGTLVDFSFKLIGSYLEKRIKKFTNEQIFHSVLVGGEYGKIPAIQVKRNAFNGEETPYGFKLIPKKVGGKEESFYYELSDFQLAFAECKLTKSHPRLNFAIELQLKVIDNKGKTNLLKSSPMSINYCSTILDEPFIKQNVQSSIFSRQVTIIEVGMKILQTNATKVSTNDFSAALWSSGEQLGTIITTISENVDTNEEDDASKK